MEGCGRKRPRAGSGTGSEEEGSSKDGEENMCPICSGPFTAAHVTPCGHQYCFRCIARHIEQSSACPSCGAFIALESVKPVVTRAPERPERNSNQSKTLPVRMQAGATWEEVDAKVSDQSGRLRPVGVPDPDKDGHGGKKVVEVLLQSAASMSGEELRLLMEKLQEQQKLNATHADNNLLCRFLKSTKSKRDEAVRELKDRVRKLTKEVHALDAEMTLLKADNERQRVSFSDPEIPAKLSLVKAHTEDLEKLWLEGADFDDRRTALYNFSVHMNQLTKYRELECVSEIASWRQGLRYEDPSDGELPAPPNIVTSIEVDMNGELVATAGVLKQIKIFSIARLRDKSAHVHFPVRDIPTQARLSSLSWNTYFRTSLICADHEGFVTLWDAESGETVREYEEHNGRIWSVDFSRSKVNYFASGSDDATVKIWDTRQGGSLLTLRNRAQVTCVKFHPETSEQVVFACADTNVYSYDLRYPQRQLFTLLDHKSASSYVAFMSKDRLVSSSIDSTLKLWDVGHPEQRLLRTFQGHRNQRNFVGLSVTNRLIACGSEKNTVYVYYEGSSKPLITYPFNGSGSTAEARERNGASVSVPEQIRGGGGVAQQVYVSAVSWCPGESPTLLAANSQGTLKMLELR